MLIEKAQELTAERNKLRAGPGKRSEEQRTR